MFDGSSTFDYDHADGHERRVSWNIFEVTHSVICFLDRGYKQLYCIRLSSHRRYYANHVYSLASAGVYGRCNTGVTPTVTWIPHGDYCYHISDGKLDFDKSKDACEDLGANLTSLGSEQETNFILDRLCL